MTWSIKKSLQCYRIPDWGEGYFSINSSGHVSVQPNGGAAIELVDIAESAREAGLSLPLLVRFTDILKHRVVALGAAFDHAIRTNNYLGRYIAVYPIKVNQQKQVVDALQSADRCIGLECGSKTELMAILGLPIQPEIVICNGYKDREYLRLALAGQASGQRVCIVIEKYSELALLIEAVEKLGVTPEIGVRVRLASIGAGNWQNTGGAKSKFGLTPGDAMRLVERLQQAGLIASLQLLHFHPGSQVARLDDLQSALREAARLYIDLHKLGAPITTLDVGGGLAVDYEGSGSERFFSMNYHLPDYANMIIRIVANACAESGITHPDIVTESGRAMTAHHAVLITNVIDTESAPTGKPMPGAITGDSSEAIAAAWSLAQEEYRQALDDYVDGKLSLPERSAAESVLYAGCAGLRDALENVERCDSTLLSELNVRLASKYFCNFSVFQSVPDVWGIDQVFPIVPLQRLDEEPAHRAILQDLTCDSDGRIDRYVTDNGLVPALPVHRLQAGEDYLLGIFLVGAYQEILGDMHNLFGDTDSVNVELTGDGRYKLVQPEYGDTVNELLRYVHHAPDELAGNFRDRIASAELDETQRELFMHLYEVGLTGNTYHESD